MIKSDQDPKGWSVLGYLAGDNNLDGAAVEDINEMEAVGSTEQMNVIVQVDRAANYNLDDENWRSTRRYLITQGADRRHITSELLKDLGPTNTGDSRFIKDFIRESIRDYPAKRYMLVLWNHGSGFYVPPEMMTGEKAPTGREISYRAASKLRRSFFHKSRKEIFSLSPQARGICYDDSSQDCLDNQELQDLLEYMKIQLDGRKVDIVGMDACLMTMIEVAYQIRDQAAVLVGSEESEPGDGWPYDRILNELSLNPDMDGTQLGSAIVKNYIDSYNTGGFYDPNVTQSAIDLSKLDDITTTVNDLATALLENIRDDGIQFSISRAWRRSTRFYDNIYMDLFQFADNLEQLSDDSHVVDACTAIKKTFNGDGAQSPIISEAHLGDDMQKVRGLSIYMPPYKIPSDYYQELDFAKKTKWGDFLDAYLRI